jgi:hypothetical protein
MSLVTYLYWKHQFPAQHTYIYICLCATFRKTQVISVYTLSMSELTTQYNQYPLYQSSPTFHIRHNLTLSYQLSRLIIGFDDYQSCQMRKSINVLVNANLGTFKEVYQVYHLRIQYGSASNNNYTSNGKGSVSHESRV